jgi:hypothetical protein
MTRPAARRPRLAIAALATLVLLALPLSGCARIINNDPDLRWFLFSNFGAQRVCPEILKMGVPIKREQRAPAIGRFFPMQCNVAVQADRRTIVVSLAGTGYGYVTPAKRVGFSVTASVEYRPDFVIAGDDIYIWAKVNRIVDGPHFQTGYIENPVIDVMGNIPPFGSIANFLGNQAVQSTLTMGFTVIHNGDRGDDFSMGILNPPQRPNHPFQVQTSERFTFANETTDVEAKQLDFLGPFEIAKNGQALFLSASVQGPAVNMVIVNKATGDAWREAYQTGRPNAGPPGPVLFQNQVLPGPVDTRRYNLMPGLYYVVIDNNGQQPGPLGLPQGLLNPLSPIGIGSAGALARVSYVAQLAN